MQYWALNPGESFLASPMVTNRKCKSSLKYFTLQHSIEKAEPYFAPPPNKLMVFQCIRDNENIVIENIFL